MVERNSLVFLFRLHRGETPYSYHCLLHRGFAVIVWAGGKFTRYFTVALPAVMITAAIGIQFVGRWIGERFRSLFANEGLAPYVRSALAAIVIVASVATSIHASPHFRLYTNWFGGGMVQAGYFFPHDEFYDASM